LVAYEVPLSSLLSQILLVWYSCLCLNLLAPMVQGYYLSWERGQLDLATQQEELELHGKLWQDGGPLFAEVHVDVGSNPVVAQFRCS
jgi:hypothetical protein